MKTNLDNKTLSFLFRDFGTLKWEGYTDEFNSTIELVRLRLLELMSDEQKAVEKEYFNDVL